MLRIFIAHSQPLYRAGLRAAFDHHTEITVVGIASTCEHLVESVDDAAPDVVLFDEALASPAFPFENVSLLRSDRRRALVIFASPEAEEERLFQAMRYGAAAYEPLTISEEELIEKLHRISNGEYLLCGTHLPQYRGGAGPIVRPSRGDDGNAGQEEDDDDSENGDAPSSLLSPREVEVLQEIVSGLSNKEVGRKLKVSDQTIKNHITHIVRKFSKAFGGCHDRTTAVVTALRLGYISLDARAPAYEQTPDQDDD